MLIFTLRRIASGVVLLLVISFITYSLLFIGGGDISRRLLGENASAEVVAKKTAELGLDRPLPVQYFTWLGAAFRGDFGHSWFTGQSVTTALTGRLTVTLSLVIGALIITVILATVIGILAARRGGRLDGFIQTVSTIGFAVPGFLFALALVIVFAINLHWFKATGYIPLAQSFSGWLTSVTLPIIALSIGGTAILIQQIRGAVLDGLARDYVRTLRARGLSANRVVYKHVLRNISGPALALLGVQFVGMLGGAVIVEQMFALPGIGQLAVSATTVGDIPFVMGVVIVTAVLVVIVNLVIDLAQAALNPKVRLA